MTGCFLDKAMTFSLCRRRSPAFRRLAGPMLRHGLLLLGLLRCVAGALAQGVLTPSATDLEKSPGAQLLDTLLPEKIAPLLAPVEFHPHLFYRFIYGDGIPATPTNHLKTVIQEISPGLLLDMGSHWSLDYTPTIRLYSNKQFPDSADQMVLLLGKTTYEDWGFNFSQSYSSTSSPLLQTEAITALVSYQTSLEAIRQLNSQWSAQMGLSQNFQTSSEGTINQDLRQWTVNAGLNDQLWSRFGAGISAAAGYDLITPGANMAFEQVQGTMNWRVKDKMSMTANAGAEITQLLGTELINPTFSGDPRLPALGADLGLAQPEPLGDSLLFPGRGDGQHHHQRRLASTIPQKLHLRPERRLHDRAVRRLRHRSGIPLPQRIDLAGRARACSADQGGFCPFCPGQSGQHFSETGHRFRLFLLRQLYLRLGRFCPEQHPGRI